MELRVGLERGEVDDGVDPGVALVERLAECIQRLAAFASTSPLDGFDVEAGGVVVGLDDLSRGDALVEEGVGQVVIAGPSSNPRQGKVGASEI